MVGTGKGAQLGILIKSGEALEILHKTNVVVLDKTGTITKGVPVLTDIITTSTYDEDTVLVYAASIESKSEHPLGKAIIDAAIEKNYGLKTVKSFNNIPGFGIEAQIDNKKILIGNKKLMDQFKVKIGQVSKITDDLANEGKTPMYMSIED